MSPVQARSARSIDDILAAARHRFGENGYHATSIDDIAADVGRTKGAIYHHYPDKQALFRRVFQDEQRAIAEAVAGVGDLRGGVAKYLRTIASSPASARITLVDGPGVLGWQAWRTCDDGPFRSMLRAALSAQAGVADRYDVDRLAELLLGAITEAALHVATAPAPTSVARRYGAQLDLMIDAIVG